MVRASDPGIVDLPIAESAVAEAATAGVRVGPTRSGKEVVEAIVRAYSMLEEQAADRRTRAGGSEPSHPVGPRLQMSERTCSSPVLSGVSGSAALAAQEAANEAAPDMEVLARKARLILSAMSAGDGMGRGEKVTFERRRGPYRRRRFEVPALLRLWADGDAEPWFLYTRNAEPRGLGFITPDRLPLGYGGSLALIGPDGRALRIDITLVRCRACSGGWYEGAMTFVRPQHVFAEVLDLNA